MYGLCRCIMFVNFLIGNSLLYVEKLKMLPFKSTFIKVLSSNPFDTKPGNKITVLSSNPIGTSPRNKILLLNSFQANVLFPYDVKHSKNSIFYVFMLILVSHETIHTSIFHSHVGIFIKLVMQG